MSAVRPYPLLLRPLYFQKVWGGRSLQRLNKPIPDGPIGESWECADMGSTSTSGAGGGPARSVIENGPLAGKTLAQAASQWGTQMLSAHTLTPSGGFPLLVKFLDACQNLSVQVHPSPAYAAVHTDAHLKTECWYILHAQPGSVIYKGVKPGTTPDQFKAAIAATTVESFMHAVPAVAGDCHNLPSGTVHALGAGVLVAEVQTPSDTTYRVYDWGREGRELHLQQALACIDFARPAPPATRLQPVERSCRLVTTDYFTLDEHAVNPGDAIRIGDGSGPAVLIMLQGSAVVGDLLSSDPRTDLAAGRTCVVPAFNTQWDSVIAGPEGARLLIARLP